MPQLKDVNASDQNYTAAHRQIAITNLRNNYGAAAEVLASAIVVGASQDAEAMAQRRVDATVNELTAKLEEARQNGLAQSETLDRIVESAKKAVEQVGVSKQAVIFAAEARLHRASADKWLKITVGLFLSTLVYGVGLVLSVTQWANLG